MTSFRHRKSVGISLLSCIVAKIPVVFHSLPVYGRHLEFRHVLLLAKTLNSSN